MKEIGTPDASVLARGAQPRGGEKQGLGLDLEGPIVIFLVRALVYREDDYVS